MTNERRVERILGYKSYFLFDGSRGNRLFSRSHENDTKEIEIQKKSLLLVKSSRLKFY